MVSAELSCVLELRNLCHTYPNGAQALRGVSMTIRAGERVGLLGPNGAGKSTLILHLNGILPSDGEVLVCEEPISSRTLPGIRRQIGLVFQNPDDQLFMPTVFDDVAFGLRCMRVPEPEVRARVDEALAMVGLPGLGDREPHHLSVGQKKRATLAGVLVLDARILVLDEPTAGLDPRGRRELLDLLASLERTLILATHDLEAAAELCTRAVILDEGTLVADGPAEEIMSDAGLLSEHGLEEPPARYRR